YSRRRALLCVLRALAVKINRLGALHRGSSNSRARMVLTAALGVRPLGPWLCTCPPHRAWKTILSFYANLLYRALFLLHLVCFLLSCPQIVRLSRDCSFVS